MGIERMALLQLLLLASLTSSILLVAAAAAAAAPPPRHEYVKSDCIRKCGNVSIVYPFGMGKSGCYHDEHFKIYCSDSLRPPKPFLAGGNIEVAEIQIDAGQLRIMKFLAHDRYAADGSSLSNGKASLSLEGYPIFTINDTRNMFTAVGCDTYAIVTGYHGQHPYATGCTCLCSSAADVVNGSCAGVGCCQVSIPKGGLDNASITVSSYYNHSGVWNFSPSSYASIVEKEWFKFSSTYLESFEKTEKLPMVLDWAVGINQTCKRAQQNRTSYACGEHADCYVPENSSGYRCKCWLGYEGNPYLLDGCTDIDECKNSTLNDCVSGCQNKVGNYTCFCPKGYHGDGRRNGEGCAANQLPVIKISVGIGVGIVILMVAGSWIYFGIKKRKLMELKTKFFQQNGGLILKQQLSGRQHQGGSPATTKIFTVEELKKATNNYDESRKIGQGGNGVVYKGILTDDTVVAVKVSRTVDQSQIEQFINEVIVLSNINHRNVVKLLGCCLETQAPLLVYEFISNGTLYDHIHKTSKEELTLPWEARLRIIVETAGVLSYLHSAASMPIIHRDIKSTNILLDEGYNAKVSDFGVSRLVPTDQNQLSTMVKGTLGYLDPEHFHTSQLTEKSDVYSFGVVLVELLTGKEAISFNRPETERNLATLFLLFLKEGRLFEILDDRIVTEANVEQLKEIAKLAQRCLMVTGEERPTMREVAMDLEGLKMMLYPHPWVNNDSNPQETEHLLAEGRETRRYGNAGGGSSRVVGFDTAGGIQMSPLDGGR